MILRIHCSGAALLIALLMLVLGSGYLLVQKSSMGEPHLHRHKATIIALHQAREALLAYAVNYTDIYSVGNYGTLPCPDLRAHGEPGNQDVPCGQQHASALGKLPWQTLGIPPLKDGSGACLWYVVSGAFKGGSSRTDLLNTDTVGTFQIHDRHGKIVHGKERLHRPAAIIIAPGRALDEQVRPFQDSLCAASYAESDYLENTISSQPDQIDHLLATVDPLAQDTNDLLLPVYPKEIFALLGKRRNMDEELHRGTDSLLARLGDCLHHWMYRHTPDQRNLSLPLPAPWVMADYRSDSDYSDQAHVAGERFGRLPMRVNSSVRKIYSGCAQENGCPDAPDADLRAYCASAWQDMGLALLEIRKLVNLWNNWKDHFFYVVSESFMPVPFAEDTVGCAVEETACLSLRQAAGGMAADWAAILGFAAEPLLALRQSRSEPPIDADEKAYSNNFAELVFQGNQGNELIAKPFGEDFNDTLYCINDGDDSEGLGSLQQGYCPGFAP